MILRGFTGNFTTEVQLSTNKFTQRGDQVREVINQVMTDADREVWRCDPDEYKDGETFEQINVYRGFITNEMLLHDNASCTLQCSDYQSAYNNWRDFLFYPKSMNCRFPSKCQFIDPLLHVCLSVKVDEKITQEVMYF